MWSIFAKLHYILSPKQISSIEVCMCRIEKYIQLKEQCMSVNSSPLVEKDIIIDDDVFHLYQTDKLEDLIDYMCYNESLDDDEFRQRFDYCQKLLYKKQTPWRSRILLVIEMFRLSFCLYPYDIYFHKKMHLIWDRWKERVQVEIGEHYFNVLSSYACNCRIQSA